jgi:adenine deaminase
MDLHAGGLIEIWEKLHQQMCNYLRASAAYLACRRSSPGVSPGHVSSVQDTKPAVFVPGVDLHNELALLVEAGFTPLEALQAATLNPAKFLGKTDTYGTIQVGRAADLVLLDMNPLEDISHTRKDSCRRDRRQILPAGVHQSAVFTRRRKAMTLHLHRTQAGPSTSHCD